MALKEKTRHLPCPGTIISALAIFLYCAGFVRVEVRVDDVATRLKAVEGELASLRSKRLQSYEVSSKSGTLGRVPHYMQH